VTSEVGRAHAAPAPATPGGDEEWMRLALAEARAAVEHGDVPVGAVLVGADGARLGSGQNRREQRGDPTAHAELEALRAAARSLGSWRLDGTTLVVTLEPCAMCAGLIVNARLGRVLYGAPDPKAGAAGSLMRLTEDPRLNHRVTPIAGVLADESAALLKQFFRSLRGPVEQ
jgi:tRNA(Arg) A34 adenosine deaminase TadA